MKFKFFYIPLSSKSFIPIKMKEILNKFDAISLEEMDNVKLMNRVDSKYIMPINKLNKLLDEILPYYKILEIDSNRLMSYKNNYFDTPDYQFYFAHHNGKLNRYKMRIREYAESKTVFTEIKFKNNKKKTKKKRILNNEHTTQEIELFVNQHLPIPNSELKKMIDIDFQRFTLVNKTRSERATIDINLHFSNENKEHFLYKTVVVEIKQESYNAASELIKALRNIKVRPKRMSKYCIGTALLNDKMKQNKFKQRIRIINKIESEY